MKSLYDGVENLIRFVGLIENEEFDECEIVKVSSEIRENLTNI